VELRDGAASREIARTEKALGLSLPDDIRAWYRLHDGSDGTDPFLWPLAPVGEVGSSKKRGALQYRDPAALSFRIIF